MRTTRSLAGSERGSRCSSKEAETSERAATRQLAPLGEDHGALRRAARPDRSGADRDRLHPRRPGAARRGAGDAARRRRGRRERDRRLEPRPPRRGARDRVMPAVRRALASSTRAASRPTSRTSTTSSSASSGRSATSPRSSSMDREGTVLRGTIPNNNGRNYRQRAYFQRAIEGDDYVSQPGDLAGRGHLLGLPRHPGSGRRRPASSASSRRGRLPACLQDTVARRRRPRRRRRDRRAARRERPRDRQHGRPGVAAAPGHPTLAGDRRTS